jgi:hypothetical protein
MSAALIGRPASKVDEGVLSRLDQRVIGIGVDDDNTTLRPGRVTYTGSPEVLACSIASAR